jgi:hypothetical protein
MWQYNKQINYSTLVQEQNDLFVLLKLIPVSYASVYYIDGSSPGKGGINGPDLHDTIQNTYISAQQVELAVLIYVLQKITDKPLNIVSDSAYVVGLFPAIETALISTTYKVMKTLLSTLHHLTQTHIYPLYITHIRAHFNLPSALV